jgi:hypothetical protein
MVSVNLYASTREVAEIIGASAIQPQSHQYKANPPARRRHTRNPPRGLAPSQKPLFKGI